MDFNAIKKARLCIKYLLFSIFSSNILAFCNNFITLPAQKETNKNKLWHIHLTSDLATCLACVR